MLSILIGWISKSDWAMTQQKNTNIAVCLSPLMAGCIVCYTRNKRGCTALRGMTEKHTHL